MGRARTKLELELLAHHVHIASLRTWLAHHIAILAACAHGFTFVVARWQIAGFLASMQAMYIRCDSNNTLAPDLNAPVDQTSQPPPLRLQVIRGNSIVTIEALEYL